MDPGVSGELSLWRCHFSHFLCDFDDRVSSIAVAMFVEHCGFVSLQSDDSIFVCNGRIESMAIVAIWSHVWRSPVAVLLSSWQLF
jgi:hypothetical protein